MTDTYIGSLPTENTDVNQVVTIGTGGAFNTDLTKFANSTSASGATGDTYYRDSSGDIVRLAVGSSGRLLTVSSGLPAWAAGMTLISSTTVSVAVSSVAFTNIPSSGYSAFLLVGHNAESAVAATTDTVLVQVSTDNGSTWKTTSGDYYQAATAATRLATLTISGSTSTYKAGSFAVMLFGLGNSSRATVSSIMRNTYGISATNVPTAAVGSATGSDYARVVKEADNAIRLISSGGSNIAGGTYQLYGIAE